MYLHSTTFLLQTKMHTNQTPLLSSLLFLLILLHQSNSQKPCPNCGNIQLPYPLSTHPTCGDPTYSLRCDSTSHTLFFDSLNGTSYQVLKIISSSQRLILQPSPWTSSDTCVSKDTLVSEGLWLNQSLPFNITNSNTVFLLNCSPRLLISPLNCTRSSLCHRFLETQGKRASNCANDLHPCCTFVAGGMPSAYKIRLHTSGCRAFRSVLHLDPQKPVNQWEQGLEIQWTVPSEPLCKTTKDCYGQSTCLSVTGNQFRCVCNKGFHWDYVVGICKRNNKKMNNLGLLEVCLGLISFVFIMIGFVIVRVRLKRESNRAKLVKVREDMLKSSNGGKSAKLYQLKEIKKATNGFSNGNVLGSGGFGEVYKGKLEDCVVAVKSAKVGNVKSTQQVLNEVGILSQVNHKYLVKLLGCCVEAELPLMVYEYISNGTLHDHLHTNKYSTFLKWETRLRIALQTAEALAYLHSSAYTPIYHRDVKSSNILLDDEFNVKVSDFGLSRLAQPGLSHVSTCAQGTLGYLDPEYYRNYQLTDKSDVYSYGVVLLELLTSQKAIDFGREQDDVNLAVYVTQRVEKGGVVEVVDQRLVDEESSSGNSSFKVFLEIAMCCLREKKSDRPGMTDVVRELQGIIQV